MADMVNGKSVQNLQVQQSPLRSQPQENSDPAPVTHEPAPMVLKLKEKQVDTLHERQLSDKLNEQLSQEQGGKGKKRSNEKELQAPLLDTGKTQTAKDQPGLLRRLARSCAEGFMGWIGKRNLDEGRIAGFAVKNGDPVVELFFEGKLSNRCAGKVLDRIRDSSVNGTLNERATALSVLVRAARQYDDFRRTSFYENYYRECARQVREEFSKHPERREELAATLSVADRWMIVNCSSNCWWLNDLWEGADEVFNYDGRRPEMIKDKMGPEIIVEQLQILSAKGVIKL